MKFSRKVPTVYSNEEIEKKDKEDELVNLLKSNEEKNIEEKKPHIEATVKKIEKEQKARSLKMEWLIVLIMTFALSALCMLVALFKIDSKNLLNVGDYGFYIDLITWGSIVFIGVTVLSQLLFFFINPSNEVPRFAKVSSIVYYLILTLCGVAGFDLLACLFYQDNYANLPLWVSLWIGGFIALIYDYFILKLFAYDKVSDKGVLWEIVRFALVGVIAAVFDFATTYGTRIILGKVELSNTLVTVIAVTMGFIVGVIVNYLCSVHMVYKASKKSNARTWYGALLFVALSAVGLGIGIGLEALLYDLLKWTYVLVFIIRTLVVMVWNYITRKIFIFR